MVRTWFVLGSYSFSSGMKHARGSSGAVLWSKGYAMTPLAAPWGQLERSQGGLASKPASTPRLLPPHQLLEQIGLIVDLDQKVLDGVDALVDELEGRLVECVRCIVTEFS